MIPIASAAAAIAASAPSTWRGGRLRTLRPRLRPTAGSTATELWPQALAGGHRGLERGAVAVDRAERLSQPEEPVGAGRRVGDVDPVRPHALREPDELLTELRLLGGAEVEPRERLAEVLLARL